jgi:delta(3,5)-delta(2,4)-dienoyl-CoA isomerase
MIVPSHHGNVLLLTLSRPPMNAFNEPFWRALSACFSAIRDQQPIPHDTAEDHDEIRVVVLASGMDKAFTAGLDRSS